jgi:hypothetical protein
MTVWTQNAKMRKSGGERFALYNFGIPAFRASDGTATCPNAGACAVGCYAKSGAYTWPKVVAAYEARLEFTRRPDFIERMLDEVDRVLRRHRKDTKTILFRIHDSGDFYSESYASDWLYIAQAARAKHGKRIVFYAYTKQVELMKRLTAGLNVVPIRLIYSLGGKQDALINLARDRHSRVFESSEALTTAQYVDTSDDDKLAIFARSPKIGLVYHGPRSYSNTGFSRQGVKA